LSEQEKTLFAKDGTAYEFHGPPDAPVIALTHGLGLCRRLWDAHLPALSQHYRVLNYDLYGHGESEPAKQTATLKVYSDQLCDLLRQANISKAALIGFSIGGMINRRFALDHAHQLSVLAILNSPHDRGEQAQIHVEERARQSSTQGSMSTMNAAIERWFTPEYIQNGQAVKDVRRWRELADASSYAQAAWVLANGVRELTSPDSSYAMPALVMTSENDVGSTPAMAKAIANDFLNAETLVVPELKHLGLLEKPDAFTTPVLNFLNQHRRSL